MLCTISLHCNTITGAYSAYAGITSLLPQLVTALVLFYGGKLVDRDGLEPAAIVSFMLYLSSLSASFDNMGSIFSSVTQAVGAADKV